MGPFWDPWGGPGVPKISKIVDTFGQNFEFFFGILNRSPGSLGPFWGPWGGPGAPRGPKNYQQILQVDKTPWLSNRTLRHGHGGL